MKTQLLIVLAFFLTLSVYSQEIKETNLPSAVVNTFNEKYTQHGRVIWTKANNMFVATFKSGDENLKALFAEDGKWVESKNDLDFKELPGSVASYIDANYKNTRVKESALRETPTASEHYYVVLSKPGVTENAEILFDLKGGLISENVPETFFESKTSGTATMKAPAEISDAFKTKFPSGVVTAWKLDSNIYTAQFISEGMTGKAEFSSDATWLSTHYTIPEKELPSSVITDYKKNYKDYKIKNCQMIQEPGKNDYYYIFGKKEGTAQPSIEVYYSITGTCIKKNVLNVQTKKDEVADISNDKETDDNGLMEKGVEVISPKELPSNVITFIKQNYKEYAIKEAVISTTDKGIIYYVKLKKEGIKEVKEMSFDVKGKYIQPEIKEKEKEEQELK